MNLKWIFGRLFSMNLPEVIWRVRQKKIEICEYLKYGLKKIQVTDHLFRKHKLASAEKNCFDFADIPLEVSEETHLLSGFDYRKNKTNWHGGFQTDKQWPYVFSHFLNYRQRDDIGDARTNWELNRHFQFSELAKNYYITKDKKYLEELSFLFENWNKNNNFLWGISWTSPMEIAIRCSNWAYTFALLQKEDNTGELCSKLKTGIINMADYVSGHYSRFSSANNHVIVEMYSLILAGALFDIKEFYEKGITVITKEIKKQIFNDGGDKEQSLHYHAFVMEALSLSIAICKYTDIAVPDNWKETLKKMYIYLADCQGEHGEVIEFGDNDNGRLFYLLSPEKDYYQYVSELCQSVTGISDTDKSDFSQYKESGLSLLRSRDRRIFIGIDHGPLGFGTIAAHGHADALSFQMFVDGTGFFIDPGTYIYHIEREKRDYYRSTVNHNTVTANGKNQSTITGPFLWSKKAEVLLDYTSQDGHTIEISHNGYSDKTSRTYIFDYEKKLSIIDKTQNTFVKAVFVIGSDCRIKPFNDGYLITHKNTEVMITFYGKNIVPTVAGRFCSNEYGTEKKTKAIEVDFTDSLKTEIKLLG